MAKKRKEPEPPAGKPPLRFEWVEAGSLTENPHNWRTHPPEQLAALQKNIRDDEIGWAGALLYNDRTQRLIDGHGRLKLITDPKELVPVLRGDWAESAEKKILATLDPLAAMAGVDTAALEKLIDEIDLSGTPEFDGLLASLEAELDDGEGETIPLKRKRRGGSSVVDDLNDPDAAGGEHTAKFRLVITCNSEAEQRNLLERFNAEGLRVRAVQG